VLLIAMVLLAVLAGWISSADPNSMRIAHRLRAPSAEHWFGTDEFGRDVFARVIYGGRVSLLVGFCTCLIACLIGVTLGVLSGFFGKLDGPITKLMEAMMAFPDILLAIALVSIFGGSVFNVMLALSIVYAPRFARISRASTLVIRELPFVEAARSLGSSTGYIIRNHVLRNIVSPVIVQATFIFAYAMLAEAGLSFLGVGVDPSIPTWGTMINEGRQYIDAAAFLILFPGLAISISVLSLQITGDGLRDALDPKLSKEL
jgi:peptide/nickel transport system permease protein